MLARGRRVVIHAAVRICIVTVRLRQPRVRWGRERPFGPEDLGKPEKMSSSRTDVTPNVKLPAKTARDGTVAVRGGDEYYCIVYHVVYGQQGLRHAASGLITGSSKCLCMRRPGRAACPVVLCPSYSQSHSPSLTVPSSVSGRRRSCI